MEYHRKTQEEPVQNLSFRECSWPFWPVVPIYPYGQRRTLRTEVVPNTIWTFEQVQGILYVVVPIRMTVVKLDQGGLLVYAPVAPTAECLRLMRELIAEYGDIKYIILPTISGIEHKVFVGPFARKFPQAQVFVAPGQWSFPINLPLSWLGLPLKRTYILPQNSQKTPFADEFDYRILGPLALGVGRFAEVAFFHRRSQTLLVTDTIVSIPDTPPTIVQLDPYPLLFHAKDDTFHKVENNETTRRRGWHRISLFSFYFRPSVLDTVELRDAFRESWQAPDRSKKAYFGIYPFKWKPNWQQSFEALRGNGRLFVAPILQTLILNRAPEETLIWANQVSEWDFNRIIPCHFDSPIRATPNQFRQAFNFLEKNSNNNLLPQEDFELLLEIDDILNKFKITPPSKPKI
ncbi:conserved hypothetical protein [Planktothrix serta PCC 8927]|uniref:DUF4336 domain-containing protein n=1 Tax=Planktothrix serta PCC 8927 TaxID=671068 RepID=A0A7Z9DYZ6_9CYAN|nr:DUF4336 domain-containing protein [Planktothrix serta]VXD14207.1 conserved hypothetical protein [Planktothrix serta PCC 8927]